MKDEGKLPMWVVYEKPSDFPDKFVLRKWLNDEPTEEIQTADTLEDIRKKVPEGLVRLSRDLKDDPVIVEVWL